MNALEAIKKKDSDSKSLTQKQCEILMFIKSEIDVRKIPPTIREICAKFGFKSTNSPRRVLSVLEEKGYITRIEGISRGIIINSPQRAMEEVMSKPDNWMNEDFIEDHLDNSVITMTKDGNNTHVTAGFLYELFAEKICKELVDQNGGHIYRLKDK